MLQRGLVSAKRSTRTSTSTRANTAAPNAGANRRDVHDAQPVCGLRHGGLRERRLAVRAADDPASDATAHATSNTAAERRLRDA